MRRFSFSACRSELPSALERCLPFLRCFALIGFATVTIKNLHTTVRTYTLSTAAHTFCKAMLGAVAGVSGVLLLLVGS